MGTYGDEFINVGEVIASNADFHDLADEAGQVAFWPWLQGLINGLESGRRAGDTRTYDPGGYIYFPPNQYVMPREGIPGFAGVTIKPHVTAIFAPGAVITLPHVISPIAAILQQ